MVSSYRPSPSSPLLCHLLSEVAGRIQHVTPEAPIPSSCLSPCLCEEGVEQDDSSEVLSVLIFYPPRGERQGLLGRQEGLPAAIREDGSLHLGLREMRGSISGQVQLHDCCDTKALHLLLLVGIHSPRLLSPPPQQPGPPQTSWDPVIRG